VGMVEAAVMQQVRALMRTPEVAAQAAAALKADNPETDGNDVVAALANFDTLWETLFPAEQARIARLLVQRVTVSQQGLTVDLRTAGLSSVIRDMLAPRQMEKAA